MMIEPPPPLVPKLESVYTRRSGRLKENKNLSNPHINSPAEAKSIKPRDKIEVE